MLGVAWTVSWLELGSFCPQTVTLRLSAETWSPPLLSSEAELTPSALRLSTSIACTLLCSCLLRMSPLTSEGF